MGVKEIDQIVQKEKWVLYRHIAQCRVQGEGWGEQQEGRTFDTSLSHTMSVYRSVAEGAAQCCESDLQGVGLLHQQWWQLVHHPALSHHLHWVNRASQDGAGLFDKFIKSPPVCCRDAVAPAVYSMENGWCHHRVIERGQEWPELPQQIQSALTSLVCSCGVISLVQFIVHVNSQVHQSTKSCISSMMRLTIAEPSENFCRWQWGD